MHRFDSLQPAGIDESCQLKGGYVWTSYVDVSSTELPSSWLRKCLINMYESDSTLCEGNLNKYVFCSSKPVETVCPARYFMCNGECISETLKCDGKKTVLVV